MNKYVIYLKFLKIKIRFFTVEKRLALKFFIKTYKNVPNKMVKNVNKSIQANTPRFNFILYYLTFHSEKVQKNKSVTFVRNGCSTRKGGFESCLTKISLH